jgi:hypothetical protein
VITSRPAAATSRAKACAHTWNVCEGNQLLLRGERVRISRTHLEPAPELGDTARVGTPSTTRIGTSTMDRSASKRARRNVRR